jgi:hypothetical protein
VVFCRRDNERDGIADDILEDGDRGVQRPVVPQLSVQDQLLELCHRSVGVLHVVRGCERPPEHFDEVEAGGMQADAVLDLAPEVDPPARAQGKL